MGYGYGHTTTSRQPGLSSLACGTWPSLYNQTCMAPSQLDFSSSPLPCQSPWLPGVWDEPWNHPGPLSLHPSQSPVLSLRLLGAVSIFPVSACFRPLLPPQHSSALSPPPRPWRRPLSFPIPSTFLVPDRGDVSEVGWPGLIRPPLVRDLTTAHRCEDARVSRWAAEGWPPPAYLALHGRTVGAGPVPRHAPDKVKRETRDHGKKICLPTRLHGLSTFTVRHRFWNRFPT